MKTAERIASLSLPDKISEEAIRIYDKLPPTIKNGKRVGQIAYLVVSEAYKSLHVVYNPTKLATDLKVGKPGNILKDAARCGYEPILCHYEPKDFLPIYLHYIGIKPEHREQVEELIEKLLYYNPILHEKTPQSVAAGVVCYYALIHGYSLDEEKFSEDCEVSLNIIKQMKIFTSKASSS